MRIITTTTDALATPSTKPIVRCAIYTRKSTCKGLDLAFNSLDAQRALCEEYVKRHEHDGWNLIQDHYNDGAISGYTDDRPALQKLIADIKAKLIDVVVVYRIDRLGRSTLNSLRNIYMFRECGVHIASVTEHIDTSTADGRQRLRDRLSYAEYERDISRERVLDKIDMSKRRGFWMGGMVPYGYDWVDKKLVVNQQEAEIVQLIFAEFIKTHSLKAVVKMLRSKDIKNKVRTHSSGKGSGGNYFSSPCIYSMLKNSIYIGKIPHQGELYDGQHQAIITDEVWQAVKSIKGIDPRKRAAQTKRKVPAILQGLLRCGGCNSSMIPSHTRKAGKLYRYYVPIAHKKAGCSTCPIKQVSATEIENIVLSQVTQVLQSPEMLVNTWQNANKESDDKVSENKIREALSDVHSVWSELWPIEQQNLLKLMVEKVVVQQDAVEVRIRANNISSLLAGAGKAINSNVVSL